MNAVSKYNPLHHYHWGNGCDGWDLVDEVSLSVKQEKMPVGSAEELHYHCQAQQFFFIIRGTARFEVDGNVTEVNAGEGIHIQAGRKHRIVNASEEDLEFILCSQPSTSNDRINCNE